MNYSGESHRTDMLNELTTALTGDRESRNRMLRYLCAGGMNTAFGYFTAISLYYLFQAHLHIVVIGLIANVICITEAFVTYRIFVFNSHGPWLHEYLRCYVVYGGSALVGIAGLWFLVNILGIPFWLAQGLLMGVSVAVSYAGHNRFTFKKIRRR